jgi:glycosyltransferase involved in cell wall biosynthesis
MQGTYGIVQNGPIWCHSCRIRRRTIAGGEESDLGQLVSFAGIGTTQSRVSASGHTEDLRLRDAIVFSGWRWEVFNVPERIALALSLLGMKVLYSENPASIFRHQERRIREVEKGIFEFGPRFFGHRLNSLPFMPDLQAKFLVRQILEYVARLQLRDPIVVYPNMGQLLPVCQQLKSKGLPLVFVCLDFPSPVLEEHVRIADKTLVISKAGFHRLKAKFRDNVYLIPQSVRLPDPDWASASNNGRRVPPDLEQIPSPRLGYLGVPQDRLNLPILQTLLRSHPDWHFVSFGTEKCLDLPNVHILPWRAPRELPDLIAGFDVGFMPYDCSSDMNFYCVPLKTFDYFAAGLPVVATPIIHLWDYKDFVYFGDTPEELAEAATSALQEPISSPKKTQRIAVAEEHSIENLSRLLVPLLCEGSGTIHGAGHKNQ